MANTKTNNNQQGFTAEYPSRKVFERSPFTGRILASVVKYDSSMHHVQALYNSGKLSDAKFDKATELSREMDKAIRDYVNQLEMLSGRRTRGKRKASPPAKAQPSPKAKQKDKAPAKAAATPTKKPAVEVAAKAASAKPETVKAVAKPAASTTTKATA